MAKQPPVLYRKRFIPDETVCLRDDLILHFDDEMIVTSWKVLKPRSDFIRGYSCCYLDKGIRISKLISPGDRLFGWYCDIMDFTFREEGRSLLMTDLLADVFVFPDGSFRLLDLDELASAHAKGLIDGVYDAVMKAAAASSDAAKPVVETVQTKAGEAFEAAKPAVGGAAATVMSKVEELTGVDLNGDGVIGAAKIEDVDGAPAEKSPAEDFVSSMKNTVEEMTGVDFDGDGAIGAAKVEDVEAPAEESEAKVGWRNAGTVGSETK